MTTMNDIAKEAGVSRGTVSNVLNGRGCVSYEKIRLVEEAAAKLGYSLDQRASTLRRGISNSIALILPNISEKKYCDIYMGVLNVSAHYNCKIYLYITKDQPYKEREVIIEATKEKVIGILTVSCLNDVAKEYSAFLSKGLPVIFLERMPSDSKLCSYTFDMKNTADLISSIVIPSSRVSLLLESFSFSDQLILKNSLQHLLSIEDSCIFENVHGGLSPASYRLASTMSDSDFCIAGSEQLASLAENAFTRINDRMPCIICPSPLDAAPNNNFINIQLNYRYLGSSAAEAVFSADNSAGLSSRLLSPSNIYYGTKTVSYKQHNLPVSRVSSISSMPKTLRMLTHNTPSVSALKTLIPEFTKNTGISVDIVTEPLSKLITKAVSKEYQWDIVRIDPSTLSHMAYKIFTPLSEIDSSAGDYFKNFLNSIPSDYSMCRKNLYAYPFDISMQMLFYRKSIFDSVAQQREFYEKNGTPLKVPETYDELESVARFFTKDYRESSPTPFGSSFAAYTSQTSLTSEYLPRLISSGSLSYSSKGIINLDNSAAISVLEDYLRFSKYADTAHTNDWCEVASGLVNGSYATSILFLHYASQFIRTEGAEFNGDIAFAPLPGGNSLLAGGSLGVGKYSRYKKESYEFIRWATGPDIADALVMLGGISPSASIYEKQDILEIYPWLSYLAKHIQDGISRPLLSFSSFSYNQHEFECRLSENILKALNGKMSPGEALSETQEYLYSLADD